MVEMGSTNESERTVFDADLGLECSIYGHAPVQADGRLGGKPFYFRARFRNWSFVLCTRSDILDAAALVPADEPGFFHDGEFEGFALWGDYGSDFEASYMPYAKAEQLIRECASRYLAASAPA